MFLKNSRYHGLPTATALDAHGREVPVLRLRRLPDTRGESTVVRDQDQLDVMAHRRSRDGTRFWHIADANTELEANELVATSGRRILVPEK